MEQDEIEEQIEKWYGKEGLNAMECCCLTEDDYAQGLHHVNMRVVHAINDMSIGH